MKRTEAMEQAEATCRIYILGEVSPRMPNHVEYLKKAFAELDQLRLEKEAGTLATVRPPISEEEKNQLSVSINEIILSSCIQPGSIFYHTLSRLKELAGL